MLGFLYIYSGILTSGYPSYPTQIFSFQWLDWAVPIKNSETEINGIYSWARNPGEATDIVLKDWAWITPWADRLPILFKIIILTSFLLFLLDILIQWKYKLIRNNILYIPIFCSAVFWFFSAPDIRFLYPLPLLLIALSTHNIEVNLNFYHKIFSQKIFKIQYIELIFILIIFLIGLKVVGVRDLLFTNAATNPSVQLEIHVSQYGVRIYKPIATEQCWDSPIPCSPVIPKGLACRGLSIQPVGCDINGYYIRQD
jgi:hypothetical protein